jgi:hypothetical protein
MSALTWTSANQNSAYFEWTSTPDISWDLACPNTAESFHFGGRPEAEAAVVLAG